MVEDIVLKASEAASYIASRTNVRPKIAILLSKGLNEFAGEIKEKRKEISYAEIPGFPRLKKESESHKMIFGQIYDKDVVVMEEKLYYYEGFEMDELTFPIRVLALLGVESLVIVTASGYISKELKNNDIMLIKDHINFGANSPLRGHNETEFSTSFPSMRNVYSSRLLTLAKEVASLKAFGVDLDRKMMKKVKDSQDLKIDLKEGVYAFMPGPQFETPAEVKMLEILGADACRNVCCS